MRLLRMGAIVRLLLEHVVQQQGDLLIDLVETTYFKQVVLVQLRLVLLLQVFEITVQLMMPGEEHGRLKHKCRGRDEEVDDGKVLEVGRGRNHVVV